ncbi:MAG: TetR/AcrR family transcriptional regulator, partial [Bacilli bacterium]
MNEKKVDLRVVKTKRLLYATLLELMKEKTFEEIKVSDICNKALVNRSTFYSHYQDKYDLFSELVMDI